MSAFGGCLILIGLAVALTVVCVNLRHHNKRITVIEDKKRVKSE